MAIRNFANNPKDEVLVFEYEETDAWQFPFKIIDCAINSITYFYI